MKSGCTYESLRDYLLVRALIAVGLVMYLIVLTGGQFIVVPFIVNTSYSTMPELTVRVSTPHATSVDPDSKTIYITPAELVVVNYVINPPREELQSNITANIRVDGNCVEVLHRIRDWTITIKFVKTDSTCALDATIVIDAKVELTRDFGLLIPARIGSYYVVDKIRIAEVPSGASGEEVVLVAKPLLQTYTHSPYSNLFIVAGVLVVFLLLHVLYIVIRFS